MSPFAIFTFGLVLVAALALLYLLRLPAAYTVQRSLRIPGSASEVFEWVQDLQKWQHWSPWLLHDPQTVLSYEGDARSVGAAYSWRSPKIGEGRISHLQVQAGRSIVQALEFFKPFKSRADVRFDFEAAGDGHTQVSWSMSAQLPLPMRPFCGMFKRMIGHDFDLGLARLAGCVNPDNEHPRISFEGITQLPAQRVAYASYSGLLSGLGDFWGPAYARLLQAAGSHQNGTPLTAYDKVNPQKEHLTGCAALPVSEAYTATPDAPSKTLPGGRYFHVRLQGHYRFLASTWNASMGQVRMQKLKFDKTRPALEVYPTDMRSLPNSNDWVTDIYVPVI